MGLLTGAMPKRKVLPDALPRIHGSALSLATGVGAASSAVIDEAGGNTAKVSKTTLRYLQAIKEIRP